MPAWIYQKGYFFKVADGEKLHLGEGVVGVLRSDGRVVAAFAPSEETFAIIADKEPTFSKPEIVDES
jgi:hypothetical protein